MHQSSRNPEAGFTLVEALIAIVILVFGLMAIANLYAVAGSSNSVANSGTAAVTVATDKMEELKAKNFDELGSGGDLDDDAPGFFDEVAMQNVGKIHYRWMIADVTGQTNLKYIAVRAEAVGALTGARSRAEFTAFRSCTVKKTTAGVAVCP